MCVCVRVCVCVCVCCCWLASAAPAAGGGGAAAAAAAPVFCKTQCCKTHYGLQFAGLLLIEHSKRCENKYEISFTIDVLEAEIV